MSAEVYKPEWVGKQAIFTGNADPVLVTIKKVKKDHSPDNENGRFDLIVADKATDHRQYFVIEGVDKEFESSKYKQ